MELNDLVQAMRIDLGDAEGGIQVDIVDVQRDQFLQADARGEEGFDKRAVAFGDLAVPTGQCFEQSPRRRDAVERDQRQRQRSAEKTRQAELARQRAIFGDDGIEQVSVHPVPFD